MKVGAEPKKIVILGVLLVAGGYFAWQNLGDPNADRSQPVRQPSPAAAQNKAVSNLVNSTPAAPRGAMRPSTRTKASENWVVSMKRNPEDALDPMKVDPTLRIDLLAKVQSVELESAGRNLFQFGTAPPPPAPPMTKEEILRTEELKKAAQAKANAPPAPPPGPPKPAGPPPLNLTWRYYGYTSVPGNPRKKAFFLVSIPDGEDILTAAEGEVLDKKIKVVRIGVNSVVLEDTNTKSQQTLPLQEEPAIPVSG